MRLTELRVDPRPVALVRIALGVALVSNALEAGVILQRIAEGAVRVPVLAALPTPTGPVIDAWVALAVLAGIAVMVGCFTPAAAAISVLLSGWVFVWDQQTYSNHRVLVTVLVAILVFAQSDASWSVRRGAEAITSVRWWPQLLMMVELSTCYFFAAANKVNPIFLPGDLFATWLRWPLPEPLYPLLAVATIVTEFFLAFALWWRRTRVIAAAVGAALHVSIVVGMAEQTVPLIAFALACVPVYALFLTRPSGLIGSVSSEESRVALARR